MSGVGLVGFSGSLIKDTIKEPIVSGLSSSLAGTHRASLLSTEPIDQPEATNTLVGEFAQLYIIPLTD
jgi:hypothetical protein